MKKMTRAGEIGKAAANRAQAISRVAKKRTGDFMDAVVKEDEKALARFTVADFWTAVESEEAKKQPTGSARKEASPET